MDNKNLAPICLFVYNRLAHTKKTIEALKKNKLAEDSNLYIFSDAAKNEKSKNDVEKVRNYIKTTTGFKDLIINEKEKNCGLADSIVYGVTEIINKHDKVIVLEDDIVTSPYFLNFMNEALEIYKENKKVMHINGYVPTINYTKEETFFYRQPFSWGWATWEDAWNHFDTDTTNLLEQIKQKKNGIKYFNLDNTFNNISPIKANISEEIKTWAIKWYASIFLNNGLCLTPYNSLIENVGLDGSGENCKSDCVFKVQKHENKINIRNIKINESQTAFILLKKFFKKAKPKFSKRIINKIKLLLNKINTNEM